MEKIFRKVSVKERLPSKYGYYVIILDDEKTKVVSWYFDNIKTWGINEGKKGDLKQNMVTYWLEEVEIPADERYDKLKSLIETAKDEHAKQIAISPDDTAHYNFQNGYGHALCNLHWKMNNLEYVGSESKSSAINVCEDCGETLTGGYEVKCGKC